MDDDRPVKSIGSLTDRYKEKPPKIKETERGELLKYFVLKINQGRAGTKYKKVTIGAIASRLTGFKLPDLYYLKSTCDDTDRRGGSWSACFYGSTKTKPNENQLRNARKATHSSVRTRMGQDGLGKRLHQPRCLRKLRRPRGEHLHVFRRHRAR